MVTPAGPPAISHDSIWKLFRKESSDEAIWPMNKSFHLQKGYNGFTDSVAGIPREVWFDRMSEKSASEVAKRYFDDLKVARASDDFTYEYDIKCDDHVNDALRYEGSESMVDTTSEECSKPSNSEVLSDEPISDSELKGSW